MTASASVVHTLYDENRALLDVLDRAGEISLRVSAEINFRKVLVMAAASYFEVAIKDLVTSFVSKGSSNNLWIVRFAQKKGLERQYHTLFQWDGKTANSFFGLFGEDCREGHEKNVKTIPELEESIRAFLELGRLRNELAHENFGVFAVQKTTEDILELYERATKFVTYLRSVFDQKVNV